MAPFDCVLSRIFPNECKRILRLLYFPLNQHDLGGLQTDQYQAFVELDVLIDATSSFQRLT